MGGGINISNRLRTHFVFPTAGFVLFPDADAYAQYEDRPNRSFPSVHPSYVDHNSVGALGWRIEGAEFGVRFRALPCALRPLPPAFIEVHIPDQTEWAPELWSTLGARDSVHMCDRRVRHLGISQHLCRALDHWSSQFRGFQDAYRKLPFASSIVANAIKADYREITFELKPNLRLLREMLSVRALRSMWGFSGAQVPRMVRYTDLRYESSLGQNVALVKDSTQEPGNLYVFKSCPRKIASMYHELKTLLRISPHPTVVGPPLAVVTIHVDKGEEDLVCGFLLRYCQGGSLLDVLPRLRQDGTLTLAHQLKWAKDVTYAMIYINQSPARFHSDLRTEHIVLSQGECGIATATVIDFEQNRNIYNWAAPEIYYLEWLAELSDESYSRSHTVPRSIRQKYAALLQRFLALKKFPGNTTNVPSRYDNPANGWYFPWLCSSNAERESAEVFTLGKVLWCIFEGVGDADIVLGRSNRSEDRETQRFPDFRRTPDALRPLIKRCTAGAREWSDGPIAIYREGGKIFPLGKAGRHGESLAGVEETKRAITRFWQQEMCKAEAHVQAREKYVKGCATEDDLKHLAFLRRPKLADVLQALNALSRTLL